MMKKIRLLLTAATVAVPLAGHAADLAAPIHARIVHHWRIHRVYAPRVHYGYYAYQWGARFGGTSRTWLGSTFVHIPHRWW